MTGQSDDYLAQLDRALERIEATNIDTQLAADHAPHLLRDTSTAPCASPDRSPAAATESRKVDLAVSLLQTDVEVLVTPNPSESDSIVDFSVHDESGLGIRLVQDARNAGESLGGAAFSDVQATRPADFSYADLHTNVLAANGRGPHPSELSVSKPLEGPSLAPSPASQPLASQDEAEAELHLESQQLPSHAEASMGHASAAPRALSATPANSLIRSRSGPSLGGSHRRRGLFSENFFANFVVAAAVATWLALGPAYLWTQHWLSEGSHVALTQVHAGVQAPLEETAVLTKTLMAKADQAQGRFMLTFALMALAGTFLLVPPYRHVR